MKPATRLVCSCRSSILLFCLILPLASVFAQTDTNLVGTWQSKDINAPITVTLNTDGTGKLDNAAIKYAVRGNTLVVNEDGVINNYTFSLRDNILTVSGGDLKQPLLFERQSVASTKGLGARRNQAAEAPVVPGPAGSWEHRMGQELLRLVLNTDGTGTFNGQPFKWTFNEGVLSFSEGGNTLVYQASVNANYLTLSGGNLPQAATFNRIGAEANAGARQREQTGSGSGGLTGRWQSSEGTVLINDNGTVVINGETYRYTVQGNIITLSGPEGSAQIPFQLAGDTLTTTFNGKRTVHTRASAGASADSGGGSSNPSELVGKWCYMSNVNASNGGRMSNRCFTLHEGGTYDYYAETSSSGQYGSTASQESDGGTWSAGGGSITVNSRKQGRLTFSLEKRNHPKTGDPMLIVDGDAFVTFHQRQPWR